MKSHFSHLLLIGTSAAALLALTRCSDDPLMSDRYDSRYIRFNAGISDMSTRSGAATQSESVALQGGEKPTWLVPLITDGIDSTDETVTLTRSTLTDNESLDSFGVFARRTDSDSEAPDYMFNVCVTRSTGWTPAEDYRWPSDGKLHFTAFAPFCSQTDTEGITALPRPDASPEVGFKVPSDVADQFDLLVATPTDGDSSPCELTFNHALTGIRFASGAELAPCTVKSIEISGVADSGTISLEDQTWSDITGNATYIISPDIELSASAGGEYVEPNTLITSGEQTLILLPQSLGADTRVKITVLTNGRESTLEASLGGQSWTPGKTVTYRISGNPDANTLILDVNGSFDSPYTGTTLPFTVKSCLSYGGQLSDIDWKAEFVDDSGNVMERPEWITDFPTGGSGEQSLSAQTDMNDIIFHSMSPVTSSLQNASDINVSSGHTPYNLASSTGASTVENTANTYIVSAPGQYSLPLVYGNAIKGGAANTAAYVTTTHASHTLKTFTNHLGNPITSPYIYDNADCTPAGAVMVWEDELNLVRDVALSADGRSLTFNVPHNTIREGNALIGVTDAKGRVMWSWQIWITSYNPENSFRACSLGGKNYRLWTQNLGYIHGGDNVEFPEATVKVRFTQVNVPDGMQPLSKTIIISQGSATISTPECNTFYQYGRKDPMMSSVKQWYNPDRQQIMVLPTEDYYSISDILSWEIQNPGIMIKAEHQTSGTAPAVPYVNLWNTSNSSSTNVKSVYDPSPAGSKVPYGTSFLYIGQHYKATFANGMFSIDLGDGGAPLLIPALGYRASSSTELQGVGSNANIWNARCNTNGQEAHAFTIDSSSINTPTDPVFHSFSVRPIAE